MEAIKCKHCGEFLNEEREPHSTGPASTSTIAPAEWQLFEYGKPLTLKCSQCGGQLDITDDRELFKCVYCQTIVLIRRREPQRQGSARATGRQAIEARTELIVPIVEKACSYWVNPFMNHGGKLSLTSSDVIFVPHRFNFVRRYRLITPIADIRRVWKSGIVSRNMNIETRDGRVSKYLMWWRDEFMDPLQRCMESLAEGRGE
jgi:DNA-directed RNA polymerase subunit RPC12/RpoP